MKAKLTLLFVACLLAALVALAMLVRQQMFKLALQERQVLVSAHTQSKEQELRHYVGMATVIVRQLAAIDGDAASRQRLALSMLSGMQFDRNGYFFVYGPDGRNLLEPTQMRVEGVDFCEPDEPQGRQQAELLLTTARQGGGLVSYDWQKPSSGAAARKLSYVSPAGSWGWVIGTGVYMDDLSATLEQIEQRTRKNIDDALVRVFAIAAGSMLAVALLAMGLYLRRDHVLSETLRQMARRLQRSREDERLQMARELHDGVLQVMASSKYLLETAQARQASMRTQGAAAADPMDPLQQGLSQLNDALVEIRRVAHGLQPALLERVGLVPAIEWLVEQIRASQMFELHLGVHAARVKLAPAQETALYRVLQQALHNVQTHARARRVDVTIEFGAHELHMRVQDDGVGFAPGQVPMRAPQGMGLINMRERIEAADQPGVGELGQHLVHGHARNVVGLRQVHLERQPVSRRPVAGDDALLDVHQNLLVESPVRLRSGFHRHSKRFYRGRLPAGRMLFIPCFGEGCNR